MKTQFVIALLIFSVSCFAQDTNGTIKVKKPETDTTWAEFPGGMQSMNNFVQANLTYPDSAIQNGLSGTCYITFVVDVDGTMTNLRVVRGVKDCPICDQEALRVIRMMPNFKPGMKDGVPVKVTYNIPINFRLK